MQKNENGTLSLRYISDAGTTALMCTYINRESSRDISLEWNSLYDPLDYNGVEYRHWYDSIPAFIL